MKKIAILLTIVLLVGLFAGCGQQKQNDDDKPEKTLDCPAPITEQKQAQITGDFEATFKKTCPTWFSVEKYGGGISYLGSSNGYDIILYNQNNQIDTPYTYSVSISGDVMFTYLNRGAKLYAYKDGEFKNLADAYNDRLVTKEELEDAAKLHAESIKEMYENITSAISPLQPDTIPNDRWYDLMIINAYCEYADCDNMKDQLQVRYFVRFDNLFAVYIDGPIDYTQAIRHVTIFGEYRFIFPTGQKMYLYRDGEICALDDAEKEAFATEQEIYSIWKQYQEKTGDRYGDGTVTE